MRDPNQMNRRNFLKSVLLLLAATPFLGSLVSERASAAKKTEAALPEGQKAAPASDPVATAIGYVPDGRTADLKRFPQAKGKAGTSQKCSGCMLYTSQNADWGKCQLISSGLVAAGGWCGSWSKKA